MSELSKRDRGAMLFQSVVNRFGRVQAEQLQHLRDTNDKLWDLRRRVGLLEGRSDYFSSVVRRGPAVELVCVGCDGKLTLGAEEAAALDYIGTCPKCKGRAILPNTRLNVEQFTARDIAPKVNLAPVTVAQIAKKYGIGRKVGFYRYFQEGDGGKIEAILATRKVARRKVKA